MTRVCRYCSKSFDGKPWMTRCKTCFIELKRREERGFRFQHAYQEGHRRGYVDGFADGSAELGPLDQDFVRELISLCHPDRHEGRFELANRVTARLVEMRDQLRRAA